MSDCDIIFLSIFWKELFRLQGTSFKRSIAYQFDGQAEVVNKRLESYLRWCASEQPRSWAKWLPWAEFSYNTTPHCLIKVTPFKLVYAGHATCDQIQSRRNGCGQFGGEPTGARFDFGSNSSQLVQIPITDERNRGSQ